MAQVDFLLKIDGVDGESIDKVLPGAMEILSYSFGATNAGTFGTGTGGGAGKVSLQDFHFTMLANKATVNLFLFMATGQHIKNAKLQLRKPTGKDGGQMNYLEYTFTDLLISSFQTGNSQGASPPIPVEQISFNYTKYEMEYFAQQADGSVKSVGKSGWDTKANSKV